MAHPSTEKLKYYTNVYLTFQESEPALRLLNNPDFDIWSGSSSAEQHHYGKHGLSIHTLEIFEIGLGTIDSLKLHHEVDMVEFFLSVLYHDSGKLFDYTTKDNIIWEPAPHRRMIHHISRSGLLWHDACSLFNNDKLYNKYHDSVYHNILSHHCFRDWGSPVMPKTRTAWLLHISDLMSARMNDCDKIDFTFTKKK